MANQHPIQRHLMYSVFILESAVSACSTTQSNTKNNRAITEELNQRFQTLVDAAESLDTSAYFSHIDQRRFTSLTKNDTVTHSFDTFQNDYIVGTESIHAYQQPAFKKVKVSVIDSNHAILINEYESKIQLKDGSILEFAGAGSQVWHKPENEWLLASVSSSGKPTH